MRASPPMRPAIERFQEKFVVTPGCWIWTAYKSKKGYGDFGLEGKVVSAHRFSYELYVDSIPEGMFVCHKCDNPSCVNPDHLFVGSPLDNTQDMIKKGRAKHSAPKGEAHGMAKITAEIARGIREAPGLHREIAAQFGVNKATVSAIKTGRQWRNA